jgi:hypothetical protein
MPLGAHVVRPAPALARGLLATAALTFAMICSALLALACGGAAPGVTPAMSASPASPDGARAAEALPESATGAPADGTPPKPGSGAASAAPGPDGGSDYPCRKWLTLDEPTRLAVIEKSIELAKAQGVIIRLPAPGYVAALDRLIGSYQAGKNEKALDSSLGLAFHILAAMEGDWDDGESKVEHAKRWLGPKLFEAFREKYPAKYQHLVELDRAAGKTPP